MGSWEIEKLKVGTLGQWKFSGLDIQKLEYWDNVMLGHWEIDRLDNLEINTLGHSQNFRACDIKTFGYFDIGRMGDC